MKGPLLSIEGLNATYHTDEGALEALHDVTLSIEAGEIVGIVGESGCGKSTLSAALLRLLPANGEITGGRVVLKSRDLLALSEDKMREEVRGRELAMIFQDPATSLNPTFTVGQQLVEAQEAHQNGRPRSGHALRTRAIEALAQVGIADPDERIDHYPHEFSGGMKQRVMIAMTLLLEPSLLIADEPTSALDVTLEAQILELLRRLREELGTAILYISHDLGVVSKLCDRVIVMYAGRCVEEGDAASIFARPLHPYTKALLSSAPSLEQRGRGALATIPGRVPSLGALPSGCKFVDRCPYAEPSFREREPQYFHVEGRRVRCHRYAGGYARPADLPLPHTPEVEPRVLRRLSRGDSARADGDLVVLQDVQTFFYDRVGMLGRLRGAPGAVRAVDGVSLAVRRGEVLGLVGESGSGKTTLGQTILRLVPATRGEASFDGVDVRRMSHRELRRFRRRAQMIFQEPHASLSPRQKVAALLTEPYAINRVPASERYNVGELLEMVGLSAEQANKYPNQLSGGQARRVGIARALALQPEFLVADEPTSGLDVSAAAAVLNLMKDLGQQLGLTYLVITHSLNVVAYLADRIAVMYLGRLVEVGPTERVLAAPAHPYTRALLAAASEPDRARGEGRRLLLPGEIPSPRNPPSGCRFHTRCAYAEARSREETPLLEEIEPGHFVACHFWRKVRMAEPPANESVSAGTMITRKS